MAVDKWKDIPDGTIFSNAHPVTGFVSFYKVVQEQVKGKWVCTQLYRRNKTTGEWRKVENRVKVSVLAAYRKSEANRKAAIQP
jgi:hypothetical protein